MAYKNKYNMIFIGAFLARVLVMIWDIYARHIYIIPNSGLDAIGFYYYAIAVSENINLLYEYVYGGFYTKFFGFIFYLIGPQKMVGHYINVLLGLSVVFIIYEILLMLEIKSRVVKLILFMAAFFPASMLMSANFLREIAITFFVACSLYFFIKWFKVGRNTDMLLSLAMIGVASIFHSGIVGIFFGYAFMFMFYKQGENVFRYNSRTVYVFIFLAIIVFLVVTQFDDLFLEKFLGSEDEFKDLYEVADARYGESAYLTDITIDKPIDFIIYGPIKAFFFLTAPLPLNWRGFEDIFTFFIDSIFYLATIVYFLKNRHNLKDKKVLVTGLALILISVSFIFGIGVGNAGTAVRHRQKITPIFLILLAVVMSGKQSISERTQQWSQKANRLNDSA